VVNQDPVAEPAADAAAPAPPQPASAAAGWLGFKVDGIEFKGGGRIDGLFVDAESGEPSWIAIRLSRFGRRTAVPFAWVAPGIGRAWIPCDRPTLKAAPSVDPSSTLKVETERALIGHFSLGDDGRAAELSSREDADPGSVPA